MVAPELQFPLGQDGRAQAKAHAALCLDLASNDSR